MQNNETRTFNILIVDDIIENIQLLHEILKKDNYSFCIATNGKEVIDILNKVKIDLILLDVMLPDTDGFHLLRQLKQTVNFKNIPVIFITALSNINDIVKGFEAGAVDYIVKPFEALEVIVRVKNHLNYLTSLEKEKTLVNNLQTALNEIKELKGILPMCAGCKSIRNDDGYWEAVDNYLRKHTDVSFTHGLCPDCIKKLYPQINLDTNTGEND